jgi:A/G-specific adenine glycosylase
VDAAARSRLLRWYRARRRDLPWRRTSDPYAILVSEVMLQQTRVDVVVPYYGRWLTRFPTLRALAAADEEEVLAAWSGLGYYRRARNLYALAKTVAAGGTGGGLLPGDAAGLRELPGVGAYTAGAVASIAFGERVPCVDGNVVRVAARVLGLRGPDTAAFRKRVEREASAWVPARSPGDWNQAVMELGATVCTPRNPRCGDCPLAASCVANAKGWQQRIPAKAKAKAVAATPMRFALVQQEGKVLLVRNPDKGLLAGLWMLPGGPATAPLATHVAEQAGVRVKVGKAKGTARHLFSHRTWTMTLHGASIVDVDHAQPGRRTWWCPQAELATAALPAAMRVLLDGKP